MVAPPAPPAHQAMHQTAIVQPLGSQQCCQTVRFTEPDPSGDMSDSDVSLPDFVGVALTSTPAPHCYMPASAASPMSFPNLIIPPHVPPITPMFPSTNPQGDKNEVEADMSDSELIAIELGGKALTGKGRACGSVADCS